MDMGYLAVLSIDVLTTIYEALRKCWTICSLIIIGNAYWMTNLRVRLSGELVHEYSSECGKERAWFGRHKVAWSNQNPYRLSQLLLDSISLRYLSTPDTVAASAPLAR